MCAISVAVVAGKKAALKPGDSLYVWTPELVRRLRAAYAMSKKDKIDALDALQRDTGWPRAALVYRAGVLGIRSANKHWTPQDDAVIRMHAGDESPAKIARHLRRSRSAVAYRIWQLGLSTRLQSGYTVSDLTAIFGVAPRKVVGWIDRGLLGRPVMSGNERRIDDDALVRFIKREWREYSLRTVDETFLKGVLFGHRQGVSEQGDADVARGSGKAADQPRRSAGCARLPFVVGGGDGRDRESAAGLEAAGSPQVAAAS